MSIRSALTPMVSVLGVSCVTLAATVTPVPDLWETPRSPHAVVECASAPPSLPLKVFDIELAAAVSALTDGPVAPTIAPIPSLIALADAIDDIYVAVEEWVRYGFEVAADIIAWIPWVGIFAGQIMVVYNFVESLINSGVFNTTDWLRGQGSALKNVADWVADLGLALVWLGIDEIGAWIPLPPIDIYPPRPPVADLSEGVLGDAVVGATHLLAGVSHAIWNTWEPIKDGVGWGVGVASDFLDAFAWVPFVPLINFQLTEGWDLIAGEVDALTGFAHDMIDAGDQFVVDTFHGDGLIAAIVNAFDSTVASIASRSGEAWQAFTDWVEAQVDYFFNPAVLEDKETSVALGTVETDETDGTDSSGDVEDASEDGAGPSGGEISPAGAESEDDPEVTEIADGDDLAGTAANAGSEGDSLASIDDEDVEVDEDAVSAEQEASETEADEDTGATTESEHPAPDSGSADESTADRQPAEAG